MKKPSPSGLPGSPIGKLNTKPAGAAGEVGVCVGSGVTVAGSVAVALGCGGAVTLGVLEGLVGPGDAVLGCVGVSAMGGSAVGVAVAIASQPLSASSMNTSARNFAIIFC
jgi:hypothetical protein